MNTQGLTPACREWLERVCYHLTHTGGAAYGFFLRRIRAESSARLVAGHFPIAIGMRTDGTIVMRLCWPLLSELPAAAGAELLKHEVLHVVFGHLSGVSIERRHHYGAAAFNLAADLVVNQYIDMSLLAKHGFEGPTVDKFHFEKNQTTVWYCEALSSSRGGHAKEELAEYAKAEDSKESLDVDGPEPAPGVDVARPWEDISTEAPPELVDLNVERLLTQVRDVAPTEGEASRGWDAGEAEEFIKALRRKPRLPWYAKLRKLESRHRSHTRTSSLLRPSRRHPLHFGRIRESSLLLWFGVDTSGSMGVKQLQCVDAELKGIAQRGASIYVLHVDAEVQKKEFYDPRAGLKKFAGRGGTDFSPFLLELRALRRSEHPSFAVFYTDGYGCIRGYANTLHKEVGEAAWKRYVETKPVRTPEGVEILWVLAPGGRDTDSFRKDVPFGHCVRLETKEEDEE
jgi:predicted metal-dependent peptidase